MFEKFYTKGGNRKKKEEAKTNPYLVANKLNQIKLKWEREREIHQKLWALNEQKNKNLK